MNMSFSSSTFRRSSSCSSCGGFEPTTPITSPFFVRIRTFCARTTWPHHPPIGRNLMNPSGVMPFTMNPTSSMWPATRTRGSSDAPFFRQMTLPRPSFETSPRPRRCFCIIPAISDSCPGGPNPSQSSFSSAWLASMKDSPYRWCTWINSGEYRTRGVDCQGRRRDVKTPPRRPAGASRCVRWACGLSERDRYRLVDPEADLAPRGNFHFVALRGESDAGPHHRATDGADDGALGGLAGHLADYRARDGAPADDQLAARAGRLGREPSFTGRHGGADPLVAAHGLQL